MLTLNFVFLILILCIFFILIIINSFNKKKALDEAKASKLQEDIKHLLAKIKKHEEHKQNLEVKLKQLEDEDEEENEIEQNICDEILLLILIECLDHNYEPISKIINKIINKYKHTDKLDKHIKYNINDIFNDASIDKQVELIKLVYTLDNVKNKKYLADNIFIANDYTFDNLAEYAIKNNMHDLFEYIIKSKSFKIDKQAYLEYEELINNKEMYLLLIKHKIEDEYRNNKFD